MSRPTSHRGNGWKANQTGRMEATAPSEPLCPSARPQMAGSVLFGVMGGTVDEPRVQYLGTPLPVTPEILALARPVEPTEVFRFAAPCVGERCRHFDGTDCRLVSRTIDLLPAVVDSLPPCVLRSLCRWWQQEGRQACLRCPQVSPTMPARPSAPGR